MEIASLPLEVLLHVLSFLPPRDLLRCRATCRQWRDLAVLPALWRHKTLEAVYESDYQLVAAALRLAPCLHKLVVGNTPTCWDSLGAFLPLTCCAVLELELYFNLPDAVLVTAALGRQAALGKLKHLSVSTFDEVSESSVTRVRQLLEFIVHTRDKDMN
ncbi:F-box only protein 27-like [Thrips palmi]|uniref:F-box only protein 27-like n=1 Tax=Thrips palmi TaxID=161013 RepID=A0A6P8ZSQ7_THRPL|nr:F-box only protein 27-like [Thrips palmi]